MKNRKRFVIGIMLVFTVACARASSNLDAEVPDLNPGQVAAVGASLLVTNNVDTNGAGNLIAIDAPALHVTTVTVNKMVTQGVVAYGDNVWFSLAPTSVADGDWDKAKDYIGILSRKSGKVRRITIPSLGADPGWMAFGPDHHIFFAETTTNAIGELAGSGIIDHYLPGGRQHDRGPQVLATAKNGVYFIDEAYRLGIYGFDGSWRYLGARLSTSASLAVNGDSVWFTDPKMRQIGRIDSNGKVSRLDVPWANATPQALSANNKEICFSTLAPYIGCYAPGRGFFKVTIPHATSMDVTTQVALAGDSLWYLYQVVDHQHPWLTRIGIRSL